VAKLNWTYFPYPFLNFNNSQTKIQYRVGDNLRFLYLDQLPVKEMRMENNSEQATILVKKGNELFNVTQLTTVHKGSRFVNISFTVESAVNSVSLDWLQFFVESKGIVIQPLRNNTVSMLDEGVKVFGQLIFNKNLPDVSIINSQNPLTLELQYNLQGKNTGELEISVSAYSVNDNPQIYQSQISKDQFFYHLITDNLNSYQNTISNLPIETFDYRAAITDNSISYIICREPELRPKFANDPAFILVFINNDVALFGVKKS
jgi:hypothetical protein